MQEILNNALSIFPEELKIPVLKAGKYFSVIYEIRLIAGVSLYFSTENGIRFIGKNGEASVKPEKYSIVPGALMLEEITDRAIGFSGFSHESELKQGFVTYNGACRIGICTSGENESLARGRITSICIRLPVKNDISFINDIDRLLRKADGGILIAGPPMSGKTTLLRYIARRLSDGVRGEYKKVCVIDERSELSDGYYLGMCTDVIRGKEKSKALMQALRLLSPQYVICDEVGSVQETEALIEGLNSGISFVASVHAADIKSLLLRKQFRMLFSENAFSDIIFLSSANPGKIVSFYGIGELSGEMDRSYSCLSVT